MEEIFKIKGYSVKDVKSEGKGIILLLQRELPHHCPQCGFVTNKRYDHRKKKVLIGSNLGIPIYAKFKIYRIFCFQCRRVMTEHIDFMERQKQHSRFVLNRIPFISELVNNKVGSKLIGISHSHFYRLDKKALEELEKNMSCHLPEITLLAVDEVSVKKKHKYFTIFTDHTTGKVVWVEENRNSKSMQEGLEYLSDRLTSLKAVSMDMWDAYKKVIQEKFPSVDIVIDRFHLSRLINSYIETERRIFQASLSSNSRLYVKKKLRWVLLKRTRNLTKKEQMMLKELRQTNSLLYDLYLLKESFLSIYDRCKSAKEAFEEIIAWAQAVEQTKFSELKNFLNTIGTYIKEILSWFYYRISNGVAEGINTKINQIKRDGYGYKNVKYFKLKILQKCGFLMNAYPHTLK